MFDARKLLDALVAASSRPGGIGGAIGQVVSEAVTGLQDAAQKAGQAPSVGQKVDQAVGAVATGVSSGQKPADIMSKAREVMANNPGLAEAAAIGLAGLLMGSRRKRGIRPNFVGLGGLALVGGLAYKAWENYQAGRPPIDLSGQGQQGGPGASGQSPGGGAQSGGGQQAAGTQARGAGASGQGSQGGGQSGTGMSAGTGSGSTGGASRGAESSGYLSDLGVPQGSKFSAQTEDDALLFVRAMVAAASADGQIDDTERSRISKGLGQAGIDAEATRWLEREMASPASVEELSAGINAPEKGAQVYTAARLAIDPDTIQEREFLRQLAESLDLDQSLRSQIDSTAAAIKLG
jgi:uncharacterized membrane protein YebE (DUF533 family)